MRKFIAILLMCALVPFVGNAAPKKKVGVIGLDTSHSPAFVKLMNDKSNGIAEFADYEVVAAYPYGSKTIESSYSRIPKYIKNVEKYGVKIVKSIDELLAQVDYVLLETNDGNLHLEQAAQVIKAGKRLFIDKPIAADLTDAIAILELAKKNNVSVFSASSLRYTPEAQEVRAGKYGPVIGADCFSPAKPEPSHRDFSWYGIHGVETLYTVMGTGCKTVSRASVEGTDVVTGIWENNRIGTFRGNVAAKATYGGNVYTKKGVHALGAKAPYDALLKQIVKFFETGVSPVPAEETLEIFIFMEASNESKAKGGVPVSMDKVYKKHLKAAQKRLKMFE